MSKINVRKIKNVECYDFETKTNIPYDKVVEVEGTKFIKQKLDEEVLEEIRFENEEDNQLSKDTEPPKIDENEEADETEASEESTEGGGKDDNSKGGKGKKKS